MLTLTYFTAWTNLVTSFVACDLKVGTYRQRVVLMKLLVFKVKAILVKGQFSKAESQASVLRPMVFEKYNNLPFLYKDPQ